MTNAPTDQLWIPALMLMCGISGYLVLLVVGGFGYITYRNRRADAPFTELGFAGRAFALQFRQYEGQWRNRAIHARWYRGPVVEFTLTLANAPTTFLGMGTRNALGNALSGLSRYTALTLTGEPFDRVMSYTEHPAWAQGILNQPAVRTALAELLTDEGATELRQINLHNGKLTFRLAYTRIFGLTADKIRRWLDLLTDIGQAIESAPTPSA